MVVEGVLHVMSCKQHQKNMPSWIQPVESQAFIYGTHQHQASIYLSMERSWTASVLSTTSANESLRFDIGRTGSSQGTSTPDAPEQVDR